MDNWPKTLDTGILYSIHESCVGMFGRYELQMKTPWTVMAVIAAYAPSAAKALIAYSQ